jgi:GNAT superfamily N-acetyltransferase
MVALIRHMTSSDVDAVTSVVNAGGWGYRRDWFAFATRHEQCMPFVAEVDGAIAGTAVATANGHAGWIGTVFVAPGSRGRGIGGALTDAAIEALVDAGCGTLVLVATEEGRPMYERRGFVVETSYLILEADGTGSDATPLQPFRADDLDSMLALDRAASGEDREHLVRALASAAAARTLPGDDGALRGFIVRAPWGGAATVAPRYEDGLAILEARRMAAPAGKTVRAGVLADNGEAINHLLATGWRETRRAPRLVRGDRLDWRPTWLWGQFNFAMG